LQEESVAGYMSEASNVSVSPQGSDGIPAIRDAPLNDLKSAEHLVNRNKGASMIASPSASRSRLSAAVIKNREQPRHPACEEPLPRDAHEEEYDENDHCPLTLPKFPDINTCMW
jgi:hypothetical protein